LGALPTELDDTELAGALRVRLRLNTWSSRYVFQCSRDGATWQ